MKIYTCSRDERGEAYCRISGTRLPYALPLRPDLKTYPGGLNWGTGMPTDSARLSVAILADHFEGDARAPSRLADALAMCMHLSFARGLTDRPTAGFQIDAAEIRAQLRELAPSHSAPLQAFVSQAFARDLSTAERPSPELLRFRYLTTFLVGLGCPSAFAQELFRLSIIPETTTTVSHA